MNISLTYIAGYSVNDSPDEQASNAIDGNNNTKWCTTLNPDGPTYLIVDASDRYLLESYTLYLLGDTSSWPQRTPNTWNIYGSNTYTTDPEDASWELITGESGQSSLGYGNYTYNVSASTAYRYFCFCFTANNGNPLMQISEITMTGTEFVITPAEVGLYFGGEKVEGLYIGGENVISAFMDDDDVYSGGTPEPVIDYSDMPFTIEALESGNFTINLSGVDYSTDGGDNWYTTTGATTLNLSEGDTVQFRKVDSGSTTNLIGLFSGNTGITFNVYGNIMSLLYGNDYNGKNSLNTTYVFRRIFQSSMVIDASNLILPPSVLTSSCYQEMFYNCTALTVAPELPATTLATYCYQDMFYGCASLTTAPELHSSSLAQECYRGMFRGCTSLSIAPELPATTLQRGCYQEMFYGCTALTSAPELPATAVRDCYRDMFNRCTSLTTAPELPSTTVAINCYSNMFYYCTNLNYVKAMFTQLTTANAVTSWLSGVSATGTFVKDANATWSSSEIGIPTGWTVVEV